MNLSIKETDEFAKKIAKAKLNPDADALICPPFTMIEHLAAYFNKNKTAVAVGAQNMHFEDSGAYTGELSADMIKEAGAAYVIIGHSERRQYFAETDETVNLKLQKALQKSIIPIVCVGETLEERESRKAFSKIKSQVVNALKGINSGDLKPLVIAYEPIWAIGTGKTATSDQAQEIAKLIRDTVKDTAGADISSNMRILYGGSVKPANIKDIMSKDDINGALVGGASLKAEDFEKLVNY